MFFGYLRRLTGIFGTLLLVANQVSAQGSDSTGNAMASVLPSLTIVRNSDTNWGRILVPVSGSATYYLDYSSGATSLVGGTGYCFSDGYAGDYTIYGSAYSSISFEVKPDRFNGDGLEISNLIVNGDKNSGTGQLDSTGALNIRIGGYLEVQSYATIMTQTATITVRANYQ